MTKKSVINLETLLERARKVRACNKALAEVKNCKTFARALKHPKAAYWAYWYACHVIRGRWPEAEAVIAQDAGWAYRYACHVINGRWPEAEDAA